MTFKPSRLALIVLLAPLALVAAQDEATIQTKVSALLSQMTVEEKVGQLVQYSNPSEATGPAVKANIVQEIRAGYCGSMFNVVGAKATRALQDVAVKETRLKIPLIFGYDVIHGFRTMFPMNIGQAASWDLAAIEKSERIAAIEASAAGIHWTFSPMVDIARDPRWGRIAEGSGEDPYLGSAIAAARVRGFQGSDLTRSDSVLACAKHFAAYGAAQAGRDYSTTDVPEITLREIYLPPFKAALDAGVGSFMSAFNDLNGVPCTANTFLFQQVLRKEWGFKGFVVSDWTSIKELIPHGIAADGREACLLGFNAGINMDMEGRIYRQHALELVQSGAISMEKLDAMVSAVLAAKFKLGLFDNPYRNCDEALEKETLLRTEHLAFARDFARRTLVLLKNEDGILPLKKKLKLAVIGPLADSRRDLYGSWQARGEDADTISIFTALHESYPTSSTLALGCQIQGDEKENFPAALETARKADLIVAVLGERWDMTGEGNCRSTIDLPGKQLALLEALHATGKPVVLVLLAGRPLALERVTPLADAILFAWYPGTMGGPAVADVLTGAYNPSGKLPATFPRRLGQVPIFYNHKSTGRPQDEELPRHQYESNYLDVPNTPQFPFGYGLSYTRFAFRNPRLSSKTMSHDGSIEVSATLTNEGAFDGEEVVQLYIRDLAGSVTRPVRELKKFAKIAVKKGVSTEIRFTLRPSDLAFYHTDMSYSPEPGAFDVFLGGDSNAPKIGSFTLEGN